MNVADKVKKWLVRRANKSECDALTSIEDEQRFNLRHKNGRQNSDPEAGK